ncbi:metallophosphoesterase family protein [Chitinophaga caseinilytica]|uniref:Metallophosphoesterase n=1 Tax=Chitinophaga caseinilytica TaxID=2267521 RepID=A0ABZ2YVU7_9BACT
MHTRHISRKQFLRQAAPLGLTLLIPDLVKASFGGSSSIFRLGLLTDLHHDIMHDGPARIQAFVSAMDKRKPDAIAQLGDFCYPNEKNLPVIQAFNESHGQRLHVIGNHDTDSGHTNEQCTRFWGIPAPYYSQVTGGYQFIVLNGNEKGSPAHKGGYPSYIGPEQAAWLKTQLTEGKGPAIILCHQPLEGPAAVDNAQEVQDIISGFKSRVVLVINGHTHVDRLQQVNGIPYLTINSASYYWVGGKYKHESYSPEVHASHPWIAYTCPYRDAVFTTLTIDPGKGTISIEGCKSEWVGPAPERIAYNEKGFASGEDIVPYIRERKFKSPVKLKK